MGRNYVCGLWHIAISPIRPQTEMVNLLQLYARILHYVLESAIYKTRLTITKETVYPYQQ